jgi:DNA ligase (NAD+)
MSTPLKGVRDAISAGNEALSRKLLQDANDAYYGDGSSRLTDVEFDQLRSEYTAKFGLALKTAPKIAAASKGRTDRQAGIAHDWPLLSGWLGKAAGLDETHAWVGKAADTHNPGDMVGSPKWDGMSIVVTYDTHGVVQRALTRGGDGLGVDVTRLLALERHFGDIDFEVPRFGVKYEVVMSWSAVEQMSVDLGKMYKNPRNTVAGIVSSDEAASRRQYITLVPLDIEWDGCTDDRMARLEFMQSLFTPQGSDDDSHVPLGPPVFTGNGDQETPFFWWTVGSADEIDAVYAEVLSWRAREDFEFMIDGVVYEFVDDSEIERLGGRSNDCPDYAIAAKFPSMTGRTEVVSIDFDLGNTGRRTPVVNYKPITMDGRTFSRTSISNFVRFDALKLSVGTPIIVEIRGDVNYCASTR